MVDAAFSSHLSEYIKSASEAFVLLKTLYPLLPTQNRDEVEAKIQAAEDAFQEANVALAKAWDFKLHDCTFPPQIMLWKQELKERVCPNCGYKTDSRPRLPDDEEDSWVTVRR